MLHSHTLPVPQLMFVEDCAPNTGAGLGIFQPSPGCRLPSHPILHAEQVALLQESLGNQFLPSRSHSRIFSNILRRVKTVETGS